MKVTRFIAAIAVCVFCFMPEAHAQDKLKPVKDKATKLYGYQVKGQGWVIQPAFDRAGAFKDGVAEVRVSGYDGVINTAGECIVPIEYKDIKLVPKRGVIMVKQDGAWGVYSYQGDLLFEPEFSYQPSFDSAGYAIVESKYNNKRGLISSEGDIVIPFEYYALKSSYRGYQAVNNDLRIVTISADFKAQIDNEDPASAQYIPPVYDTRGELVRAYAYGHRMIGLKNYRNMVFLAEDQKEFKNYSNIRLIPADYLPWYDDNCFLRLEPVVDTEDREGSFEDRATGKLYTIAAYMYDGAGQQISVVSNGGRILAEATEGIIYLADDNQTFFLSRDLNTPYRMRSVRLTYCRIVNTSSMENALGLDSSEIRELGDRWYPSQKHTKVELQEKAGAQSYNAPFFDSIELKDVAYEIATKYHLLSYHYYKEDMFLVCGEHSEENGVQIRVEEGNLIAKYYDDYDGFRLSTEEPVYWGPQARRYLQICPVPFRLSTNEAAHPEQYNGTVFHGRRGVYGVCFDINLFEYDGSFVRTVAHCSKIQHASNGVIVFAQLPWAFGVKQPVRKNFYTVPVRLAPDNTLSILNNVEHVGGSSTHRPDEPSHRPDEPTQRPAGSGSGQSGTTARPAGNK